MDGVDAAAKGKQPSHGSQKPKVSKKNNRGTELFDAVYHGKTAEIKELLFTSTSGSASAIKDAPVLPILCLQGAIEMDRGDASVVECLKLLASADIPMDAQDRHGRTTLHLAVQHGRYEVVRELVHMCRKLDQQSIDGQNCIHVAVIVGDLKMTEYLLEVMPAQARDAVDRVGRSPLYLALLDGSIELFECLLFGGCNPNGTAPDGRSIIIHAMEKNLPLHLQRLIQHGVVLDSVNGFTVVHFAACQEHAEVMHTLSSLLSMDFLCAKDKEGKTPLMYMAMMGLDQNMKFLLEAKISILHQDNEGKSALHYAATNRHCGCVDLLCQYDPNILSVSDINGNTPGHDAIMAQNELVLKAVIDNGLPVNSTDNEKHSLVHWATVYNCYNGLETLIKAGASVNQQDDSGATPLHYACQLEEDYSMLDRRNQILQLLTANNASFETEDNTGRRPIHWAASSGNRAALELLVRKGATIDVGTKTERLTALHLAASQGFSDCVQFLVENSKTSVNLLDATGCTPLFYACAVGDVKSVKTLLGTGANINVQSVDGKRPLHCAASQKNIECLLLLIEEGADLNHQSNQGESALHEAASAGQVECVQLILNHGYPPDIPNKSGATPLHFAVAENRHAVIEQLLLRGAKVNAIFPTGIENNYVSPLDIALSNGDYSCVTLLQSNGGRTGHSIVQNAATTIQHTWKAYKDRRNKPEGSTDPDRELCRSRRSTLSESVSIRDERALIYEDSKGENGILDHAQRHHDPTDGETRDKLMLDNFTRHDEYEINDAARWAVGQQYGHCIPELEGLTRDHRSKGHASLDPGRFESIRSQLAQGRKAMNDMKNFLLYAENQRGEFARVSQEAKYLVDSEDFKTLKAYNQKMRMLKKSQLQTLNSSGKIDRK